MSAPVTPQAADAAAGEAQATRGEPAALVETALVLGAFHGFVWIPRPFWVDLVCVFGLLAAVVAAFRRRGETPKTLGMVLDARAGRAVKLLLPFLGLAIAGALAFYLTRGPLIDRPLWPGFLVAVLTYPIWGFLQQLFYLGFGYRGLRRAGVPQGVAAIAAGLLYGMIHAPNWPLVLLTTPMGLYLAWVYTRSASLIPIGIVHGIGGAFAIYLFGLDLNIGAGYIGYGGP
jgi:membrane protease YdiL (CAAX protease family)